ncbi:MAG: DUF3185 domain-containing protein [Acidobacteriota bacterium]|nr:MAG: DUF3185 domain-containing protein [Acidobacteriota bacterium]
MKILGILLIVLGLIGFIWGGVSWTRDETVLDAGPLEIQAEKREGIPMTPVASGISLVAGLVLVVAAGRRS